MATGDDFPLRQGAGTGSRLVFGGYRGLRRQNSRSIFCLEVLVYVGIYGCREYVGGATGAPRGRGARPGGVGSPPTLVGSPYLP